MNIIFLPFLRATCPHYFNFLPIVYECKVTAYWVFGQAIQARLCDMGAFIAVRQAD